MSQSVLARNLEEAANQEQRDPNLWAKCFVEAEGDTGKAQALYVRQKMASEPSEAIGYCPNCTAECAMTAARCSKCGADFMRGGWKPKTEHPKGPAYGAPNYGRTRSNVVKTAKSRGIYVILGLFLGSLGIHNFYAGRFGRGAGQLVCTITVIGIVVSLIWAISDLFLITTDGAGDLMS